MNKPLDRAQTQALARIKEIVGPKGWIAGDDTDGAPYLAEQRGLRSGRAALIVRPCSTEEVSEVVAVCNEARLPVVPQGGNTSLVGAAIPDETGGAILLSTARMNRIRSVDPANDTIAVDAGCVLADIQKAAEDVDRLFPLSLGAEGTCRIGGNLSTNAGGINVLRYGNARALVLGLEAVLPDGRVWDGMRALRKDNTGYDLKQLFIGAEGTLGVITGAVLKLFPRPRAVETALVGVRDPTAALALLNRARGALGDTVTGFELMPRIAFDFGERHVEGFADPMPDRQPWTVLIEVSGSRAGPGLRADFEAMLGEAAEAGEAADAVLAESEEQRRRLWLLREGIVEAQKYEGGSIKHDVSVPVSKVAEFVVTATAEVEAAMPGVRVVAFGHLGDGNVHFNLSQPEGADREHFLAQWSRMNRVVHDIVAAMGGSISAEHGIGVTKREELAHYRDPLELELMRAVKAALDPRGIMNPGKVL